MLTTLTAEKLVLHSGRSIRSCLSCISNIPW